MPPANDDFIQIPYYNFVIFNKIRAITKGWGSFSAWLYLCSTRKQRNGF